MYGRRLAVALAVVLLAVTAGCGFITGQSALTFSASPTTVADGAQSETGYEEVTVEEQTVTRTYSGANRSREVEVTNQLAQYERQVDLGPLGSQRAAVFVTLTSPEVEVGGRTFNPISDMSEREILAEFESQYEGVSVGDSVDSRSTTVLGKSVTVEKFEGTATLSGTQVDTYVHAVKLKHETDYVVAVAIYPQQIPGEEEEVFSLLDALEHSGE